MALEFNDGVPSVRGREKTSYFEKGCPVNPEGWEIVKKIPEQVKQFGEIAISYSLVTATFNRLFDSGIVLHDRLDRLKVFCREHGLSVEEDRKKGVFIIRNSA